MRSGKSKTCWACNKLLTIPPRIKIGQDIVILNDHTKIFGHHVDRHRTINFKKNIVGQVVRNPSQREQIGLRNYSDKPWKAKLKNGREVSITRGSTVGLDRVDEIHFGDSAIGFVRT